MSVSYIPQSTKLRLWAKSGGRCEYEGCNAPLWLDELTKSEFNQAYIAHIIADKPNGPRGDPELSEELKSCITNLMLLCDECHRRVDRHELDEHPAERLREMKAAHEARIEIATGIDADRSSHILLYGPNIGDHTSPLAFQPAANAMVPHRYPASRDPIRLDIGDSPLRDGEPEFWALEEKNLDGKFHERIDQGLASGSIQHLSVFALAPQPLLIRLGTLLADIVPAEVYQLHREPAGWKWPSTPKHKAFKVHEPDLHTGKAALVLSLSATISDGRIADVLGADAAIWRISVPKPNHDCIQSRKQLSEFRQAARRVLDQIKAAHGEDAVLHIFPAAPVSAAVELGRVRQPKADLVWQVYDQNKALGGFEPALKIE